MSEWESNWFEQIERVCIMFQLGAFTDEISQDLAKACQVCNEFGVTGAELRGIWDTGVHKLTDAQVGDIKRIITDHGMVVASIGSPFGKCELDNPQEVAEHMDILRRCADVGLELGCSIIRGFAFWGHGARLKPWDAMRAAYAPVPGILEEKGVLLALENEHSCYVGTAGHVRHFIDMMQCPRIKAVWDPANHIHDPDSDTEPVFPDAYECSKKTSSTCMSKMHLSNRTATGIACLWDRDYANGPSSFRR